MDAFPPTHQEQRETAEHAWHLAMEHITSNALDEEDEAEMLRYLREVVSREGETAFRGGMYLLTALLTAPTIKDK
jgi:hypothetical protein